MEKKTKKKNTPKKDLWPLIQKRLQEDFGLIEEQIIIIEHVLRGYMPAADAQFAAEAYARRSLGEQDPREVLGGVAVEMPDGAPQTFRLTAHPTAQMHWYLTERYGETFGAVYWMAYMSPNQPQEFYGVLKGLKRSLQSRLGTEALGS